MALTTIAVAVGDNCVDHYLPPIERNFSGGNAVNVAVALQRAGCPTAYIGAIGDDPDGKTIVRDLGREGVDTTHVKVYPGCHTACTHIRLTSQNERQFVFEDLGPKDHFLLEEPDLAFIAQHHLIHNTWQGGTEKYLARFKRHDGLLISQDYGERYTSDFIDCTIPFVDVAFFSIPEDAPQTMNDLAQKMSQRGPRLVVVTQGAKGSLAFDGNLHFSPAYPIEVIDTLGAGDAFIGTFLAHWLKHEMISQCMDSAAKVASETCSHFGGW